MMMKTIMPAASPTWFENMAWVAMHGWDAPMMVPIMALFERLNACRGSELEARLTAAAWDWPQRRTATSMTLGRNAVLCMVGI